MISKLSSFFILNDEVKLGFDVGIRIGLTFLKGYTDAKV
tara:strand:- start:748 stop:864 length:117 start_codon:yes stop_codon:yes gene_type:complete